MAFTKRRRCKSRQSTACYRQQKFARLAWVREDGTRRTPRTKQQAGNDDETSHPRHQSQTRTKFRWCGGSNQIYISRNLCRTSWPRNQTEPLAVSALGVRWLRVVFHSIDRRHLCWSVSGAGCCPTVTLQISYAAK